MLFEDWKNYSCCTPQFLIYPRTLMWSALRRKYGLGVLAYYAGSLRHAFSIWVGKLELKTRLENLAIEGKTVLQWIL
jgi:hypothetical protein